MAHTLEIRRQVEFIFGSGHGTVYPLVIAEASCRQAGLPGIHRNYCELQ